MMRDLKITIVNVNSWLILNEKEVIHQIIWQEEKVQSPEIVIKL